MMALRSSHRPAPPVRAAASRRTLLTAAAGAVATTAYGAVAARGAAPLTIVVAGGHPGDPEYGCGGTVACYTEQGHKVVLLYLNRGEGVDDGEAGCPERYPQQGSVIRVQEALAARDILAATAVFAGQCNGHAVVDPPHYKAFAELLRDLNPDVVFNQWPIDNHPDHRALSNLTYEAWIRMGRTPALYYYEVSNGEDTLMFTPSDYVDISATEARKRQACYAHASQTPDRFYALQSDVARFRGIRGGVSPGGGLRPACPFAAGHAAVGCLLRWLRGHGNRLAARVAHRKSLISWLGW
jgi:N-acetylglucosamine malate deacetylase 1